MASIDVSKENLSSLKSDIRKSLGKSVYRLKLQPCMKLDPQRFYKDIASNWLLIILALLGVSYQPLYWMYAIAFPLIGFCQYRLFILGHDAIHGTLHSNRALNDRLAKWTIYGPLFMGLEDARRNHLKHHQGLGTPSDPDRYLHILSNKNTPLKFLLFCSGLATFWKTVLKVTPFGQFLDYHNTSALYSVDKDAKLPSSTLINYIRQRVPVLFMQTLLISLLAILGLPLWSYPVLWVAPIYFCVFVPDEIRAFCDHAVPLLPDYAADTSRLVTFTPTWWERILFSPHNMNYHAEHHLWPNVPYYNLPQMHELIKNRPEITIRTSYFVFLFQIFQSLPLAVETNSESN